MKNETTLLTAEQVRKMMHNCSKYASWQAIADELNAKLESGTCEMIPLCSWLFECSKCGERHHKDDLRKYNYCPNCGAKVVK